MIIKMTIGIKVVNHSVIHIISLDLVRGFLSSFLLKVFIRAFFIFAFENILMGKDL